ncbi:MAG: hypothetical protein JSR85_04055 [Proteobacteria bacterium]|nr:hypothetical protein [Pseudomonadota bacterium]
MGMFSRLVLGSPVLLPLSNPMFHASSNNHQFPDSGSRNTLRLFPSKRLRQKRRQSQKGKMACEEECFFFHVERELNHSHLDFMGDVTETKYSHP